ncbi:MAG: DUF899 family protein [Alphaproteobacteria bacterium]
MTAPVRFPNESDAYRAAREELLAAEVELRRKVEDVAALRRKLPPGGAVGDYTFQGADGPVALVDLFTAGKDTLLLYSYMVSPGKAPCPMCTALLDSLDGTAPHVTQTANLAIAAKAPYAELATIATARGWRHLRLLSSGGTGFNADYHAEAGDEQFPMLHVFTKGDDGIRHAWSTELFYAPAEPGQNPRHMDLMFPLWTLFDTTPGGRPNWFPSLSYD